VICSVIGCNNEYYAKTFCKKHYQQVQKHGIVSQRTIYDPNEFIIISDICWVILFDKKCTEVARSKFLAIYYDTIKNSNLKWHLLKGYVVADWFDENGQKQQTSPHQSIIQLSGRKVNTGEEIDHKDRDPLNNLDDNLRICTRIQNSQNKEKHINNSSGYIGVSWDTHAKKWRAYITINYKKKHLGNFTIKEDAARAYNVAAIHYFGEFAVLNNV